jgi:hypothetical protein
MGNCTFLQLSLQPDGGLPQYNSTVCEAHNERLPEHWMVKKITDLAAHGFKSIM